MSKLFEKKYIKLKLNKIINIYLIYKKKFYVKFFLSKKIKDKIRTAEFLKVNLCSGPNIVDNYINIDVKGDVDIKIDLKKSLIPLPSNSTKYLVCMSAINYFNFYESKNLIQEIFRIMAPEGIVRFGVQDLELLIKKFNSKDYDFYFQTLPNIGQRFPGETLAMKFNHFFNMYGHKSVFDFETLRYLLKSCGFVNIYKKKFQESLIPDIYLFDNRPEMFFYIECTKENYLDYFESAKKLLISKDYNQAWQYVIKCLDLNLSDEQVINFSLDIMDKFNCYENAMCLIKDYEKETSNHKIFKKRKVYFLRKLENKSNQNKKNQLIKIFNEIR